MSPQNDLYLTCFALIICVILGVAGFRNHFKLHEVVKPHRPPWMIISLGSIATGFMLLVHLVNLIGFETGR